MTLILITRIRPLQLLDAVKRDNVDEVTDLLRLGVSVNAVDLNDYSVLHCAQSAEMASLLVRAGASLSALNELRFTPLLTVILWRKVEVARVLVNAGADVNAVPMKDGPSALTIAAWNNSPEITQMCVDAGAVLNQTAGMRRTAHHFAAIHGHCGVVEILCRAGASMCALNDDGQTPLAVARSRGQIACADLLESPVMRRANLLVRASRFEEFGGELGSTREALLEQQLGLHEYLLIRVFCGVENTIYFSECRLVCKTWRRNATYAISVLGDSFFKAI
jgi:ankyrin repeat protein